MVEESSKKCLAPSDNLRKGDERWHSTVPTGSSPHRASLFRLFEISLSESDDQPAQPGEMQFS